jgi:hypothetical protein
VSSHAKSGRQAQLSKRAHALRPSVVLGPKDSSRACARVCALRRENSRCASAVARRDHQKRTAYAEVERNDYDFVSFSVESYGHIGQPAMKLLHQLGHEAASPGGVTWAVTCVS